MVVMKTDQEVQTYMETMLEYTTVSSKKKKRQNSLATMQDEEVQKTINKNG